MRQAAALVATVIGQDLGEGANGVFRIARRVAPDRVISTVDPQTRHGRKTAARGFDGYKGHLAEDPDSELITATEVTAGNAGDATAAPALLADDLPLPRNPARGNRQRRPARPVIARRRGSMGTPLRVPVNWSRHWSDPVPMSCARCSRRPPPVAGSPRTRSASI